MEKKKLLLGVLLGALVVSSLYASARGVFAQVAVFVTSVTATPSTPLVRSPVSIRVNGSGTLAVGCLLTVTFGDGNFKNFGPGTTLPLTTVYSYTVAGDAEPSATVAGGSCPFSTATTNISVRTAPTAPFSLRRVEVRFENGRGEITVGRDQPGLKAFADVLFNGTGLFTAAWEVDGRTLAIIHEYLTFGSRKVFVSPEMPPFPTFEPGLHTVTFRVINPLPTFIIPSLNYYVEAKPAGPSRIELMSPSDKAKLPEPQASFRWRGLTGIVSYRVEIFAEGKKEPVFQALTRETSYVMPDLYYRLFAAGSTYRWQTKGLDEKGAEIAESEARGFVWQP